MGDKCWEYISSRQDDYIGLVETHISAADVGSWRSRARKECMKLIANPARPSRHGHPDGWTGDSSESSAGHANEGGEWFLAKGHLQTHVLHEGIQSAALQAKPSTSVDGFLPEVLHFSGYSIVVIFSMGFVV